MYRFFLVPILIVLPMFACGSSSPGTDAEASQGPVAGQLRVAIGTGAPWPRLRQSAQRFEYVVLHAWQEGRLRALKAANPEVKVLVYKNLTASQTSSSRGRWATGVSFQEADREHPEWFLLNTLGQRFTFRQYSYLWAMDVGNPDYQRRWFENVRRELKEGGWDGVLVDDTNPTMKYHYAPTSILRYPTDQAWQYATEAALAYIGPRLRAEGRLVVPNFGSWSEKGYTEVVDSWLQYVSGGMEEHFLKWSSTGRGYADPERWRRALGSLQQAQAAGKIFFGLTTSGNKDARAARYGWATMLLVANGKAAYAMQRDRGSEVWFPEYGYDLGKPTESVTALPSGVYRRRFSRGIVLVNPTYARASVTLDRVYSGSGQRAVHRVRLRPQHGVVLRSAKERGASRAPSREAKGTI
jgi:hypothetical protein